MIKAHADASPSSSDIWINCAASVTKARGRQRLPTPYTREGTAAHVIAEGALRGKPKKGATGITVDGELIQITTEMLDAVGIYRDYVAKAAKGGELHVETRVTLDVDGEVIFGTSDAFIIYLAKRRIKVIDFKYGQGHIVSPGASQFRIYGLGVLNHIGPFVDIREIELTVVQPRTDADNPVRGIVLPVEELIEWERDVLKPAVAKLAANDQTETPGDHCRWCVRAGECQALADRAMSNAKVAFGEIPPDPSGMSDDELGLLLDHAIMIRDWVSKVMAEASQRIDHGSYVPGWKLVAKRATRRWADGPGAVSELVKRGIDPMAIMRIETLGTVEKVMKRAKVRPEVLDPFTIKQSSGSTLVSEKDSRISIDNSAQTVFGNVAME